MLYHSNLCYAKLNYVMLHHAMSRCAPEREADGTGLAILSYAMLLIKHIEH